MTSTKRFEDDIAFIKDVVARTHRRVDAHAFHGVYWGVIVMIWFPLFTTLERAGRHGWQIALNVTAVAVGFAITMAREAYLARHPRLPGENTFLTRQVTIIVYIGVGAGTILSAMAPEFGLIENRNVPILWGGVYTYIACMLGVLYNREFLISGAVIFAAVLAAIVFQEYNGYILGPAMGLGMIVPGLSAERRVRRLLDEERERPAASL